MSTKIKQFQVQYGLVSDGILGKITINKLKEVLSIETDEQIAHFLGQTAHESGDFSVDTENLMYSVAGLLSIFKKYFKTIVEAKKYAKQPIKIANRVYANRMGNGTESTGDGWKYKGRGALQLTGKDNYQLFSNWIGEDCVKNPELVAGKYFFESAKFYFDTNHLWKYTTTVDDDSITKISKAINLGNANSKATPNGLSERIDKTFEIYQQLK
ncbi:glycoside hydrolase family 19 protein [Flavobacterium muglaense]|uniref:Glycoside hydrolase family 19 protein n=1 Tax=Flavobacterium muglaense TaxID=2764716 RepID=A0A923SIF4_9FLAO|nr:glycoside hydrolase family 19 protein [Flavobacterium muglaense]MBC5836797.1 glycoside hydrolase family 19 protein [Flavobacterium muglaense]MBC5843253.1 glycoside hydrolase family 19 protein [Flavobacterium muglaense]